jgi:hypothetical protein
MNASSPISRGTWDRLAAVADSAVRAGWAIPGVFSTAVGPDFEPRSPESVLYVGKSGGPLIDDVGLNNDQAAGEAASTRWMMQRRNPSAFWRFADLVCPNRAHLAWSNVAKIDRDGSSPPSGSMWRQIEEVCLIALREELVRLEPMRAVFVTGSYQRESILRALSATGYRTQPSNASSAELLLLSSDDGRHAFVTRHPQGWLKEPMEQAARFIRELG